MFWFCPELFEIRIFFFSPWFDTALAPFLQDPQSAHAVQGQNQRPHEAHHEALRSFFKRIFFSMILCTNRSMLYLIWTSFDIVFASQNVVAFLILFLLLYFPHSSDSYPKSKNGSLQNVKLLFSNAFRKQIQDNITFNSSNPKLETMLQHSINIKSCDLKSVEQLPGFQILKTSTLNFTGLSPRQVVHVDPSAKFLESTSVLHRDFRRFDQKQMSLGWVKSSVTGWFTVGGFVGVFG